MALKINKAEKAKSSGGGGSDAISNRIVRRGCLEPEPFRQRRVMLEGFQEGLGGQRDCRRVRLGGKGEMGPEGPVRKAISANRNWNSTPSRAGLGTLGSAGRGVIHSDLRCHGITPVDPLKIYSRVVR